MIQDTVVISDRKGRGGKNKQISSHARWVLFKEMSPHVGSDVFKSETFPLLVSILSDCFDRSLKKKSFSFLQIQ